MSLSVFYDDSFSQMKLKCVTTAQREKGTGSKCSVVRLYFQGNPKIKVQTQAGVENPDRQYQNNKQARKTRELERRDIQH